MPPQSLPVKWQWRMTRVDVLAFQQEIQSFLTILAASKRHQFKRNLRRQKQLKLKVSCDVMIHDIKNLIFVKV